MADPVMESGRELTYEDYLRLPDDRKRYEIYEGELAMTPSPSFHHQEISRNLEFILHSHVRRHALGHVMDAPLDVILDTNTVVVPDLLFIAADRMSIVTEKGVEGPPDLVIEILSPGTQRYDRIRKLNLYAKFGVHWYWILDPAEETLEEYELCEGSYVRRGSHESEDLFKPLLFPGLDVELKEVWG
jgi:Uma2 family endonuclease